MIITDDFILSLDIFDIKGRLKLIAFNKIIDKNPEIKEYLKNRFKDKFVNYKTALWRIRKGIENWPTCPTCGKMLDNLNHKHCSTRCSSLDPEVQKKNKNTNLKLHGFSNPFNNPSVRKNAKISWDKSIIEKYGSIENFGKISSQIANKAKEIKSKEDTEYYHKIKQKENKTKKQKSKEDPNYLLRIKEKEIETKKKNGTLNSSKPEENTYNILIEFFSKDNVFREYIDKIRYPFHCDFYIKPLDLFIELNLHWSHGYHWFDKNSSKDLQTLQKWKDKNTKFYDNAINTWTVRDIKKRKTAKKNNLNYLVFWNNKELNNWLDNLSIMPNKIYKSYL